MTEHIHPEASKWTPGVLRALQVAGLLVLLSSIATALNISSWNAGGVTILWPSNGLLVGILLCAPRRHWPVYFSIGYVVDLCVNLALGERLFISGYFSVCNMLEVLIAAALLYRVINPCPDLTQRRQMFYLVLYGVILAPAVASFMVSFYMQGYFAMPNLHSFHNWFTADALGLGIVTPLYLSFQRRAHFEERPWFEIFGLYFVLCAITGLVFWEMRYPLLFLILPCLLLVGLRLRLAGSGIGLLLVSAIGGFLTAHGRGPIYLTPIGTNAGRSLVLQLFLGLNLIVLYILEVMISESQRLQLSLQESENRFRILAEASRDVIVLSDLTGIRRYVSPAVSELLGWRPEELVGKGYREIVHPDDLSKIQELIRDCRAGKISNSLSYRCRRKDGSYLWMEANLRLYHDSVTGEPMGFVNVVRDIATRKAAEEELHQAFHLAENLASVDVLTGLANRRRLDETLEIEWNRAMRQRTPVSLIVLDVDCFKLYNDRYGHLQGDSCLRQISDCASSVIQRSSDLLARYGGEEFVVVLPNTDRTGAQIVAEEIRSAVESMELRHDGNPHQRVTVSAGCATHCPQLGSSPEQLFRAADKALYQAKASGRNRIEAADEVLVM